MKKPIKKKLPKVSAKRKEVLKKNHNTLDPLKLKPSELFIYNKRKAGLKRQANATKGPDGKFITNYFKSEIIRNFLATKGVNTTKLHSDNIKEFKQLLKNAKVTDEELKTWYGKNVDIFEDMIEKGTLPGTSKDSADIEEILKTFKRKIFVDIGDGKGPKEYTKIEVSKMLLEFKQFSLNACNVVDFALFPLFKFNGDMVLDIPNVNVFTQLLQRILDTDSPDFLDIDIEERSEGMEGVLNEMYNNDANIILYTSK